MNIQYDYPTMIKDELEHARSSVLSFSHQFLRSNGVNIKMAAWCFKVFMVCLMSGTLITVFCLLAMKPSQRWDSQMKAFRFWLELTRTLCSCAT